MSNESSLLVVGMSHTLNEVETPVALVGRVLFKPLRVSTRFYFIRFISFFSFLFKLPAALHMHMRVGVGAVLADAAQRRHVRRIAPIPQIRLDARIARVDGPLQQAVVDRRLASPRRMEPGIQMRANREQSAITLENFLITFTAREERVLIVC